MPRTKPVAGPLVSRRRVLAGAALAVLGITAPGCGSPPAPPAVDELESQLSLARQDSELATAAAAGATAQPVRAALMQVASERTQHARALATEIARLAVNPTSTTSPAASTTTAVPAPPPALADVINALRASAASAGQLATTLSGYRAGLLGSIAAACTAAHTVALKVGGSAS